MASFQLRQSAKASAAMAVALSPLLPKTSV